MQLRCIFQLAQWHRDGYNPSHVCGGVAEWSKALAWKVSIPQKGIEGSNPSSSAIFLFALIHNRPHSSPKPREIRLSTDYASWTHSLPFATIPS